MKTPLAALLLLAAPLSAHDGLHPAPQDGTPAASAPRAPAEPVEVGRGPARFVTVPGWCEVPEGEYYGSTHGGIAVAKDGSVFLTREAPQHSITVHDPAGKLLRSIDGYPSIHDLKIVDEGEREVLYAAHLGGQRVVKMTLKGELLWEFRADQLPGGGEFKVTAVAVGPDGRVYACDGYNSSRIHVLDAEGKYLTSFGEQGSEPGQLQTSHGIAVDPRGDTPTLLVADRENHRVQRFDLDGKFLEVVAKDLRRPCAFGFWGEYVAIAELRGRVVVLDGKNEVVSELGTNDDETQAGVHGVPPAAWREGVFTAPHGLAYDRAGNLIVMDWNQTGRITFLRRLAAR
ncbi:MAG: hypothetical protein H6828_06965 [Planctomycetes bacterium]|nr:hypothetical protein [Planctomycetota bacterium]